MLHTTDVAVKFNEGGSLSPRMLMMFGRLDLRELSANTVRNAADPTRARARIYIFVYTNTQQIYTRCAARMAVLHVG